MSAPGAAGPLLECVPNVSEGRDAALLRVLGASIEAESVALVDVHSDPDHHRSVFTFLGAPERVERAALALALAAVARIDLRRHRGCHPRIGAVDVVPFVPLRGTGMSDAVAAAHRMGRALADTAGVPVFFYGEAALAPERRELPLLRRGGFEAHAERFRLAGGAPDAGPAAPHPTAGATVVGARRPLIAFNAMLVTADRHAAQAVADAIRESSPSGLPAVRALGFELASRGVAQVSMNLLDFRRMPPAVVAVRVEEEARRIGTRVAFYELVGCAPASLFARWPPTLAPVTDLKPTQLLAPDVMPAS